MSAVDELRVAIERLAAIDRASCSPGEHRAADLIAEAFEERGARARVERERVHGTYWWPLGLAAGLGIAGAVAARRGARGAGTLLAAAGAAAAADDLTLHRRALRRVLPRRTTANVLAETGDAGAANTLIVVAHHDAAHSGFFFDPRIEAFAAEHLSSDTGAAPSLPPLMLPIVLGPATVAAGALLDGRLLTLAGAGVCAGIAAVFTEIALRPTVPGANDNLTGVATLLGLARALRDRPIAGLRVLLVSTGSEEALMDGMWAFVRRHLPTLDRRRTSVLCVDTVGSPHLELAEAEGMLRVLDYDPALKDLMAACAAEDGVPLRRGLRFRLGTDGFVALRHGIPAAMLTSGDARGMATNYHWPTDTPDRVDYGTLGAAVGLCERFVRRLADDGAALS